MEPSTHGGRLAHAIHLAQGHDEGVVHGVLRLGAVAQDSEGLPVERRPVTLEQYPEARRVAPLRGPPRSASLSICPLNTRRPLSATPSVLTLDKMRGGGRKFEAGQ